MTDALAERLVHLLEASALPDRERRRQLAELYRVQWKGLTLRFGTENTSGPEPIRSKSCELRA